MTSSGIVPLLGPGFARWLWLLNLVIGGLARRQSPAVADTAAGA